MFTLTLKSRHTPPPHFATGIRRFSVSRLSIYDAAPFKAEVT